MASLDSFVLLSVLNLTNLLHLSTATNPFADHTRNPMKKKPDFNYFCDRFLIYHNKFQWKPQGYEKKSNVPSKMKQKTRSILF